MSKRKPYNDRAGYIASLRSGFNKGWIVIYNAEEAGIDCRDGKYAVVCETHGAICNTTSMPKARSAMKAGDFCQECRKISDETVGFHRKFRGVAATVYELNEADRRGYACETTGCSCGAVFGRNHPDGYGPVDVRCEDCAADLCWIGMEVEENEK